MKASAKSSTTRTDVNQVLLSLSQKARLCEELPGLNFLLVNASYQLSRYRQALLWIDDDKPKAVSGVITSESTSPLMRWLKTVYNGYLKQAGSGVLVADQLPLALQVGWQEFLPPYALWLSADGNPSTGILLVRDMDWTESEIAILNEWWQIWLHAYKALDMRLLKPRQKMIEDFWTQIKEAQLPWYRRKIVRIAFVVMVILFFPVKMTVIAPGQIVPFDPLLVNSPIDGLIAEFYVQPGQVVSAGDPLFRFDSEMISSQLEAAEQAHQTSMARYRQVSQQALNDERFMERLAELSGEVQQRRVELTYLQVQSKRMVVTADQSGVVLFGHASEWVGKPVSAGQQVMKVIDPEHKEIEAWLSVEDAIPLSNGASVKLHINSAPFSPAHGTVRFIAYDANEQPNGFYAYRLRASFSSPTSHRVGLKGTVRVSGHWTVLIYWLLRRPLGSLRAMVGI